MAIYQWFMEFIPPIMVIEGGCGGWDGGGRRRLVSAEAIADGSGWRLAAEPSPKQGKTEEEEAEQPEGEEGQAPASFAATAASRLPAWVSTEGRVSAAGGSERRERSSWSGKRGGHTGRQGNREKGKQRFWVDLIYVTFYLVLFLANFLSPLLAHWMVCLPIFIAKVSFVLCY